MSLTIFTVDKKMDDVICHFVDDQIWRGVFTRKVIIVGLVLENEIVKQSTRNSWEKVLSTKEAEAL